MIDQTLPLLDQATYGIVLLLGLAICFFGYRLLRFWLALAGLQAGFYLGSWAGAQVLDSPVLILVVAILGAILLAGLFVILIKVGGFLAGAGVMVLLAILLMRLLDLDSNVFVLLAALLIGGLLGILAVKVFLVLATAFNGAWLVADSVSNLISGSPVGQYVQSHDLLRGTGMILLVAGVLVLTVLGSIVQFQLGKRRERRGGQKAAESAESAGTGGSAAASPAGTPAASSQAGQPPAAESAAKLPPDAGARP